MFSLDQAIHGLIAGLAEIIDLSRNHSLCWLKHVSARFSATIMAIACGMTSRICAMPRAAIHYRLAHVRIMSAGEVMLGERDSVAHPNLRLEVRGGGPADETEFITRDTVKRCA